MKEVHYDNSNLIEAWIKAGIRTPEQLHEDVGISKCDIQAIAKGTVVSTELIANTLAYINKSYDEGSYEFLDPWIESLRTVETRAKRSEAQKGKILSPETRAKMAMAHKGKIHSPETRAKIGMAHKGKILSPETRAKMSERRKKFKQPI